MSNETIIRKAVVDDLFSTQNFDTRPFQNKLNDSAIANSDMQKGANLRTLFKDNFRGEWGHFVKKEQTIKIYKILRKFVQYIFIRLPSLLKCAEYSLIDYARLHHIFRKYTTLTKVLLIELHFKIHRRPKVLQCTMPV